MVAERRWRSPQAAEMAAGILGHFSGLDDDQAGSNDQNCRMMQNLGRVIVTWSLSTSVFDFVDALAPSCPHHYRRIEDQNLQDI